MTANEFAAECGQRYINPAIALESDAVRQALESKDDGRVLDALDSAF